MFLTCCIFSKHVIRYLVVDIAARNLRNTVNTEGKPLNSVLFLFFSRSGCYMHFLKSVNVISGVVKCFQFEFRKS